MSVNEVDIIKGARELLSDPKRWHKGSGFNEDHSAMCIIGALIQSAGRLNHRSGVNSAQNLVGSHIDPLVGIVGYNDDPQRTHQDILDLFDKTLADLGGLA